MTAPDPRELLDIAERIAEDVGTFLVAERPVELKVDAKSTPTDAVTEMDEKAQELIIDQIVGLRGGDGVLGEEQGGGIASESGVTWIVDPIDGTVNYLYGRPDFAVSIAAVQGPAQPGLWTPLAGAVYCPARKTMWSAATGLGATRDGVSLGPSSDPQPAMSLVATGFGYDSGRRAEQATILQSIVPAVRDIRRAGSAALDLCAVADGSVDAYYEWGLGAWDYAAADLVVRESGRQITGIHTPYPAPSGVIAGAPTTCQWLGRRLSELKPVHA